MKSPLVKDILFVIIAFSSVSLYLIPIRIKIGLIEVNSFRILLLIVFFMLMSLILKKRRTFRLESEDYLLLIFYLWLCLTLLWTKNWFETLRYLLVLGLGVLFYYFAKYSFVLSFEKSKKFDLCLNVMKILAITTVAIISFYFFILKIGARDLDANNALDANSIVRAVLPFFPVAFFFLSKKCSWLINKCVWWAVILLIIVSTFFSGSRSGALAIVVAFAMILIKIRRYFPKAKLVFWLLLLFGLVAIANPLNLPLSNKILGNRVIEKTLPLICGVFSQYGKLEEYRNIIGIGRSSMYEYAIDELKSNPFLGHGYGIEKWDMSNNYDTGFVIHNDFLAVTVGGGSVALLFYLLFWGALLLKIYKAIRLFDKKAILGTCNSSMPSFLYSILISLIILLILSNFNPGFSWPSIWFFAALGSALARNHFKQTLKCKI